MLSNTFGARGDVPRGAQPSLENVRDPSGFLRSIRKFPATRNSVNVRMLRLGRGNLRVNSELRRNCCDDEREAVAM